MSWPVCILLVYYVSVFWIVCSNATARPGKAECSFTYSNASSSHQIDVKSQMYLGESYDKCEYNISAPGKHYIELNFTSIFGFLPGREKTMNICNPELTIKEFMDGKKVEIMDGKGIQKKLTNSKNVNNNYETPQVFQSNSSSLQIIYIWKKCSTSGFTVYFDFHKKNKSNCAFSCDGNNTCLKAKNVCNGVTDCYDKTDEATEKCPQVSARSTDLVPYIVIVATVVIILLFVVTVCLVRHNNCRVMSQVRQRHGGRDGQLRPQSENSEVFVSSPTQEQFEQQVSLLRDRYTQINSVKHDTEMDYPPHVSRSKDGEEGYIESQKDIANQRNRAAHQECFQPPPNRTVHDRESPPPYYSNSARSLDSLGSKAPQPPSRVVRDSNGCPVVIRCYSMSVSANGENNPDVYSNSHSRTSASGVGQWVGQREDLPQPASPGLPQCFRS